MQVKHWMDVPEQPAEGVEGVTVRWVIAEGDGAPHFAMRIFDIQPGSASPYHHHWWEHEVYILGGHGVAVYGDGSSRGETPVGPGSVILVEGGEMHQFRNTGEDVLRFICLIPHMWLEGLAETHS
jgi:quercetin dioxygenase-like cupin family protein